MGLGPSIKMTTLHHFRCPITNRLCQDEEIDFCGIILDGVSEDYDNKVFTAKRVGDMALCMGADGAVVSIDGWGNHHIDFVSVIEQLGKRGIPSVGLSYLGTQGRLVCDNCFVDCIVDFNKQASGYESCVVGQNNLSDMDAYKAIGLLKNKMRKAGVSFDREAGIGKRERPVRRLRIEKYAVEKVAYGESTSISGGRLELRKGIGPGYLLNEERIRKVTVSILKPRQRDLFVNSNLDFWPIACKVKGEVGEGITRLLEGVAVMLTGVEEGGYQPANIGSSEGILQDQVVFGKEGTPGNDDFLIHIDFLFCKGEGRTAEGIMAAHRVADRIIKEIREAMKRDVDKPRQVLEYEETAWRNRPRIVLVKIVSGLGNMYDTAVFPMEPGGFIGAHNMMASKNLPYCITPNQCRDGAIHSLI